MNNKTKHILIKVTRDLIDTGGIEAVSMREVGKRAGLSRSALYRHFENKESLLATIVAENFIILEENINKLKSTHKCAKQLLSDILLMYYNFGLKNPGYYKLMLNTEWDTVKFPEIHNAALSVFQNISNFIYNVMPALPAGSPIVTKKTAILYAFIHGLVELHLTGHNEVSKGLDEAPVLIQHMVESIFKT